MSIKNFSRLYRGHGRKSLGGQNTILKVESQSHCGCLVYEYSSGDYCHIYMHVIIRHIQCVLVPCVMSCSYPR